MASNQTIVRSEKNETQKTLSSSMASKRSDFHAKGGGSYIYSDHPMMTNGYDSFTSTALFEFNESDIWGGLHTQIPPFEHKTKQKPNPKPDQKTKTKTNHQEETMVKLSSPPLNIPDWSRILKDHHRQSHRKVEPDDDYDDRERVPPHEILARRRGASLSVQEGMGRTLKGRDLSRVRNAVWKRTGFED